jgi:L-seryl-tRNA(Ser) seleniumtransferase
MVEIGGSFRMPDVVRQSGCRLVEVGCTNKTHMSDYQEWLTEDTIAVLRCHPSNFKIVGFTEEPTIQELATFCKSHDLFLIDDQGSGSLLDLAKFGLPSQPTLPGSIAGGADIAIASGDKLLGGPQCGMIIGKHKLISEIKKHPLARCVRIDKLTLAGLEATLRLYAEGREDEIPTVRYLGRSVEEIRKMAGAMAKAYKRGAEVQKGTTEVGGGAAPGDGLPTWRVGLRTDDAEKLSKSLRMGDPPVIGRIEDGRVWLDPRTLEPDELKHVVRLLNKF